LWTNFVDNHNETRRKLLKELDKEGWTWELHKFNNREGLVFNIAKANFFQALRVSKKVFELSEATYKKDKEKGVVFVAQM
jgi:hypothetical protein